MNKRTVDFLNISSFLVEVERVKDPALKGCPAVVAPLNSDSAKIWDVSPEAKELGIVKGMELVIAKRIERSLKIAPPNPDLYQSVHRKLMHQASRMTPLFEEAGLGKIYLDFTGFDKLYGSPDAFARKIKDSISYSFNLRPRLGVSSNKLVAKAATNPYQVEEDVFSVIEKKAESFLEPFPGRALPVVKELQKSSIDIFEDLNLVSVKDLKSLDLLTLEAFFPGSHELIFEMARGIDHRPVIPPKREPSVFVDAHLEETNELNKLRQILDTLAENAFSQLRAKSFQSKRIKVALRYADYKYLERVVEFRSHINYAHEAQAELERSLGFLFTRRTSVRYLALELLDLSRKETQLSLLEDSKKPLMDAIDSINKKFPRKLKLGKEVS